MKLNSLAIVIVATALCGCASHDGVYSPACEAYTGSTIELAAGRFNWQKFTDEMIVGKDGEAVNQFPGYPLQGSYHIEGDALQMKADTGVAVENMYLLEQNHRRYLLTVEQLEAAEKTGVVDACALTLGGTSNN